jgi:glycosyltransferase involved in cell wall biosynthesis
LRFRVAVVGEGAERAAIESRAAARGVSDVVVLVGHQPEVSAYYALASAAAICSRSEGSPNALLEAMAAGVPVVAAAVGGVPEIATHEVTALLVSPADPPALARALARLLSDRALAARLAARAREEMLANFTPQAHRRALVRFYESLVGEVRQVGSVRKSGTEYSDPKPPYR